MKWIGVGIGVGLTALACGWAVAGGGASEVFIAIPITALILGLCATDKVIDP